MAGVERQGQGGDNIVEILALYLAGKIDAERFSEQDLAVKNFYLGLMAEDPKFAALVNARKEEILNRDRHLDVGRKIPLFSDEELEAARHHKKRRKHGRDSASQPRLLTDDIQPEDSEPMDVTDPEKGISVLHRAFQSRNPWERREIMDEETRFKRNKLREEVGLPVARGKDPHKNDRYYKFLVKRVVRDDEFGIFSMYYSAVGELPPELTERINDVRGIISGLLTADAGIKEKFRRYGDLKDDYYRKWNDIEEKK